MIGRPRIPRSRQLRREGFVTEYNSGGRWQNHRGEWNWFVGQARIAPGYVKEYMREGGKVIARKVGPWREIKHGRS